MKVYIKNLAPNSDAIEISIYPGIDPSSDVTVDIWRDSDGSVIVNIENKSDGERRILELGRVKELEP